MTGGSPYSALEIETWRRLLAHGALLRSSAAYLGDFHDLSLTQQVVRSAAGELTLAAQGAALAATDDAAVRGASLAWATELTHLALTASGPAQALLTALQVCAGQASNLDPYRLLFDALEELSAVVYGECWDSPTLSLAGLMTDPHLNGLDDLYPIAGLLESRNPPVVELQIYPEAFRASAYAVIPRLFVHEFVCHVPARGGPSSNTSAFAEGFMDWASEFFFERWIALVDPSLAPTAIEHSRAYDQVVTRAATPEGAARRRGRRAAEGLVIWLVSQGGRQIDEASAWLARQAVLLNCVDAPEAAKDQLVIQLSQPFSPQLDASLRRLLPGGGLSSLLP